MFFLKKFSEFQLDVVGFLAVLGEGSVQANAHIISLSYWCYLPRLLPAPQVLLPAQREGSLRTKPGYVTGVFSGNLITGVNHIADVLVDSDDFERFEVRCVTIDRHRDRHVRADPLGPVLFVTLAGCASSIGLLVASVVLNDGMSLLATILLSALSSLTGIGNKWDLGEPEEEPARDIPRSDLVIRYPNGSFLVVKCDEITSRELFFTRKDVSYKLRRRGFYRIVSLLGTFLLMLGVVVLANAKQALQISWAAVFVVLNAAYWIAAALPKRSHWDLSRYDITESVLVQEGLNPPPKNERFTDALWQVILFARGIEWARIGEAAAPRTPAWDSWLEGANGVARSYERYTRTIASHEYKGHLKWPHLHPLSSSSQITAYYQPRPDEWNHRAQLGRAIAGLKVESATPDPVSRRVTTQVTTVEIDPALEIPVPSHAEGDATLPSGGKAE